MCRPLWSLTSRVLSSVLLLLYHLIWTSTLQHLVNGCAFATRKTLSAAQSVLVQLIIWEIRFFSRMSYFSRMCCIVLPLLLILPLLLFTIYPYITPAAFTDIRDNDSVLDLSKMDRLSHHELREHVRRIVIQISEGREESLSVGEVERIVSTMVEQRLNEEKLANQNRWLEEEAAKQELRDALSSIQSQKADKVRDTEDTPTANMKAEDASKPSLNTEGKGKPNIDKGEKYSQSIDTEEKNKPSTDTEEAYEQSSDTEEAYEQSSDTEEAYEPSMDTKEAYEPSMDTEEIYKTSIDTEEKNESSTDREEDYKPNIDTKKKYKPSIDTEKAYKASIDTEEASIPKEEKCKPGIDLQEKHKPGVDKQKKCKPKIDTEDNYIQSIDADTKKFRPDVEPVEKPKTSVDMEIKCKGSGIAYEKPTAGNEEKIEESGGVKEKPKPIVDTEGKYEESGKVEEYPKPSVDTEGKYVKIGEKEEKPIPSLDTVEKCIENREEEEKFKQNVDTIGNWGKSEMMEENPKPRVDTEEKFTESGEVEENQKGNVDTEGKCEKNEKVEENPKPSVDTEGKCERSREEEEKPKLKVDIEGKCEGNEEENPQPSVDTEEKYEESEEREKPKTSEDTEEKCEESEEEKPKTNEDTEGKCEEGEKSQTSVETEGKCEEEEKPQTNVYTEGKCEKRKEEKPKTNVDTKGKYEEEEKPQTNVDTEGKCGEEEEKPQINVDTKGKYEEEEKPQTNVDTEGKCGEEEKPQTNVDTEGKCGEEEKPQTSVDTEGKYEEEEEKPQTNVDTEGKCGEERKEKEEKHKTSLSTERKCGTNGEEVEKTNVNTKGKYGECREEEETSKSSVNTKGKYEEGRKADENLKAGIDSEEKCQSNVDKIITESTDSEQISSAEFNSEEDFDMCEEFLDEDQSGDAAMFCDVPAEDDLGICTAEQELGHIRHELHNKEEMSSKCRMGASNTANAAFYSLNPFVGKNIYKEILLNLRRKCRYIPLSGMKTEIDKSSGNKKCKTRPLWIEKNRTQEFVEKTNITEEILRVLQHLNVRGDSLTEGDIRAIVGEMVKHEVTGLQDRITEQAKSQVMEKTENGEVMLALQNNLKISITNLEQKLADELERIKSPSMEGSDSTVEASASLLQIQDDLSSVRARLESLELEKAWLAGQLKNCCRNESFYMALVQDKVNLILGQIMSGNDTGSADQYTFGAWLNSTFIKKSDLKKYMADFGDKFSNKILQEMSRTEATEVYVSESGGQSVVTEKVVRQIVTEALEKFSADKIALPDFALESAGGSIISTKCSETFHKNTARLSILGIPLWYVSNSPRSVIQPETQPGSCWAFQGDKGHLVIELSDNITPTAFTLEHIPKSLSPEGKIDSAPKDFTVIGLNNENDKVGERLGNFTYTDAGPPLQSFKVQKPNVGVYKFVQLSILSNHGNPLYTCLYRFRVHGIPHKPKKREKN